MKKTFTFLLAMAFAIASFAQGVTTSSISGKVTDDQGEALIGVAIEAIHTPSGTSYGNITDSDGFFRIPNMRVGGPYTITYSYIGFADKVDQNIYLRLGQAQSFATTMTTEAIEIEGVEVIALRNDIFDGNRTGSETTVTEDDINKTPTVSRSIADFTRLTPSSTSREDEDGFVMSFGGQNNRYNSIYIDGAINNDVFGLSSSGTNGGQTGVSPISVDAIEEFQVAIAPFDVRISGFAGASISALTRSGTNKIQGSAYTFLRNQGLAGKTPTDDPEEERTKLADFTANTYGFRLGGPIIKNKLFFFVNAELERNETPLQFNFDEYIGDASRSDIDALVNKLEGYGYDPGGFENNTRYLDSDKFTVKFDYNLNSNHKLALRHGYVKADNLEGTQSDLDDIRFLNSSEAFISTTNSTSLELNSVFGSKMSNSLTLSYVSVKDDRDPSGDPFPTVRIFDGSGDIQFGSEAFSTANLLNQNAFTINNNLSLYKGRHTLLVGVNAEFYKAENLFIPFNYGSYEFDSLSDFMNDSTSSFYIRSYSLVDNVVGDESKAISSFSSGQFGLYLQDEHQVNDNFKVTLGVRLDLPFYDDTPVNEQFNEETIPMLSEFHNLQGAETGQFVKANPLFSPRIGFNWNVKGENKTQVRGGVGVFTSRAPLVWIGGAYNNYGLNRGTTLRFGDLPFIPNINEQPPGIIDPSNPDPSGSIDLFADDFKLPQRLKTNLALDQKLPGGIIANVDLLYTKVLQDVAYQNVNLRPSVETLTGTPDTRNIYDRRDEIASTYDRILLGYNTTEGYSYNASISLSKNFSNGFKGMLAYSYGDSYSVFDGTSSQNSSQWRGLHSIQGRNIDQVLARSDFAQGNRFIAALSYEFEWLDLGKTTISLFHESLQGAPYSYIYNDGGRLTDEDSRERALIYVPQTSDDIILVEDNGLSPEEQWELLDAFIANDDYLSTRRGDYAERNESWSKASHVMDLKFIQEFFLDVSDVRHKVAVSLDIFNFTNLLNKDWGRRRFTGSFNNFELLDFEGMIDGTNTPQFSFNPDRLNLDNEPKTAIDDGGSQSSRWQMQLGLRYTFN